jgi:beta-glucosidase-like glycosyl hydrolase|eukprot:378774-Prymnesium_polylepis.2
MFRPTADSPPYNWWSEASTGVASGRDTQTTKFAFPITTGMSFNRSMWQLTGRQIATEARAMMNAGNGYSTFWAPVINLAREPRWGRNIETPGEDPYHSGEYATAFVKGFQESPLDEGHLLVTSEPEHEPKLGKTHKHDKTRAPHTTPNPALRRLSESGPAYRRALAASTTWPIRWTARRRRTASTTTATTSTRRSRRVTCSTRT